MGEEADITETLYEHKWLFVIIPVMAQHEVSGGSVAYNRIPRTEVLFSAYCKSCDSYYTKTLAWSVYVSSEGTAGLPRFGCVGPEGRF